MDRSSCTICEFYNDDEFLDILDPPPDVCSCRYVPCRLWQGKPAFTVMGALLVVIADQPRFDRWDRTYKRLACHCWEIECNIGIEYANFHHQTYCIYDDELYDYVYDSRDDQFLKEHVIGYVSHRTAFRLVGTAPSCVRPRLQSYRKYDQRCIGVGQHEDVWRAVARTVEEEEERGQAHLEALETRGCRSELCNMQAQAVERVRRAERGRYEPFVPVR